MPLGSRMVKNTLKSKLKRGWARNYILAYGMLFSELCNNYENHNNKIFDFITKK